MALLDTRGVFRRCPHCDTAVSDDARACVACGEKLDETATRQAGGARPGAPPRAVFGAAGGLFGLALGAGTSGFSAAAQGVMVGVGRSFGEVAVKLLGMKTGEGALDVNPWADFKRDEKPDAVTLFKRRIYRILFPFRTGIREDALITLYRDLAKYAESGVGFHDALARIERTNKSPVMKRMLHEVREDVLGGSTLADAFGKHEYLLDPLHVALIDVGESLGTVADNMRLAVEIIEERKALRTSLLRKLIQPIGLIFIANYVLTIPIFYVGGIFAYASTVALPTMMIAAGFFFATILVPVVIAAMGRDITDRIRIELPAFGTIARANALGRFARALGAALEAGVEVEKSLRLSARAADNVVIARAIEAAIPFVRDEGLAAGLHHGGVIPDDVAADLSHGEATGTLGPTLRQVSKDARERAARGTTIVGGIFAFAMILFSALYCVFEVFTKVVMTARIAQPNLPHPSSPFHIPGLGDPHR